MYCIECDRHPKNVHDVRTSATLYLNVSFRFVSIQIHTDTHTRTHVLTIEHGTIHVLPSYIEGSTFLGEHVKAQFHSFFVHSLVETKVLFWVVVYVCMCFERTKKTESGC